MIAARSALCGESPPVCRALRSIGPESALLHSHQLISHPEATTEDLRRYVTQCLDRDFAAESVVALNRLLEIAPRDASNWILAGEYERARGNYKEALTHVDRALDLQSDSPMAHWLGATLATESSDSEIRLVGRQRLWRLADRRDFVGLCALSQLAVGDLSDEREIERLIEKLNAHPMATKSHRLAGEYLRFRQASSSVVRADIVAAAELYNGKDSRTLFLAWLNRVGEFGRVLTRLSFDDAQHDRDLFLVLCKIM